MTLSAGFEPTTFSISDEQVFLFGDVSDHDGQADWCLHLIGQSHLLQCRLQKRLCELQSHAHSSQTKCRNGQGKLHAGIMENLHDFKMLFAKYLNNFQAYGRYGRDHLKET